MKASDNGHHSCYNALQSKTRANMHVDARLFTHRWRHMVLLPLAATFRIMYTPPQNSGHALCIISTAGHNRLKLVGCAPCVVNLSLFIDLKISKILPKQAQTGGLFRTWTWPFILENDRSQRQNTKFQVVQLETITVNKYTATYCKSAFHRPQQWVECASWEDWEFWCMSWLFNEGKAPPTNFSRLCLTGDLNYVLECNIIICTLRRFKLHLIVHQLLANAARFLHPNVATRCSLVRGNPAICITMNDLPNMRHARKHESYAAHDTCALKRNDIQFVYICPSRDGFYWIVSYTKHLLCCDEYNHATEHCRTLYRYSLQTLIRAFP
jgi:hypothetical protein